MARIIVFTTCEPFFIQIGDFSTSLVRSESIGVASQRVERLGRASMTELEGNIVISSAVEKSPIRLFTVLRFLHVGRNDDYITHAVALSLRQKD